MTIIVSWRCLIVFFSNLVLFYLKLVTTNLLVGQMMNEHVLDITLPHYMLKKIKAVVPLFDRFLEASVKR